MTRDDPDAEAAHAAPRLDELWPALPAFRAIAETEHLPTAARLLGVTPSALSRTLKRLETALGDAVFDRVGRGLKLNGRGTRLLMALRASQRELEGAIDAPTARGGDLHIAASTAVIAALLHPALAALRSSHPNVIPHIHAPGNTEDTNRGLREGTLDVALLEHPRPDDVLTSERLVTFDYGVYCGPGHPLHGTEAGVAEALTHPFVGPTFEEVDRFPPEFRRCVTLRVYQMGVAIAFCQGGAYLTVLPSVVVAQWPGPPLWRLPNLRLSPGALHLVQRASASGAGPGQAALAEALKQGLQ